MEFIIISLIVLYAVYYVYNHIKKEISGEGSCNCSSCPISKKTGCYDAKESTDDSTVSK